MASTSYLNNLCERISNDEDFDLNVDFERTLRRNALNDEAQADFNSELLPAVLTSKIIGIENEVFEESKEEIIEYMKRKRAYEDEQRNIRENEEIQAEDIINSAVSEITVLAQEEETDTPQVEEVYNEDVLDFNITFNHNGIIIKHKLETLTSNVQYTTELDSSKGVLKVVSNRAFFSSLYKDMESYCIINIINAISDVSIIETSEENVLDSVTLSRIRASATNTFHGEFNTFRRYNNML